jgi:hypothetical protein
MGFSPGMNVLWHAVDTPKPWRRNDLWELFRHGRGVGNAHRRFWHYADGPVHSWTEDELRWRRFRQQVAVALSRVYHSA